MNIEIDSEQDGVELTGMAKPATLEISDSSIEDTVFLSIGGSREDLISEMECVGEGSPSISISVPLSKLIIAVNAIADLSGSVVREEYRR